MTDYDFTSKIQDWVMKTGGVEGRSVADASLEFTKTPLEIVAAVRDGYWMYLWQKGIGVLGEDDLIPSNPDWSTVMIQLEGE